MSRKLVAIFAADVVGYSRLMGADEAGTLAALQTHQRELIDPKIAEHQGRLVKTAGDSFLIEFPSVVEAVQCAVEIQRAMRDRNSSIAPDRRLEFRIGINIGDVITEDQDVYGDGVNIAARLQQAAKPYSVYVSEEVHRHVGGKLPFSLEDLGFHAFKNIARPIRVYAVSLDAPAWPLSQPSDKPSVAVLPFDNMSGDSSQDYLADGIVEEIIAALSRVRSFFVIARNSTFTCKGKFVRVDQVGRELGVRYVVEGSVKRSANRVRLTAQLIEAETGYDIWADHFEGDLGDIFDLQDQITERVVGAIEPSIRSAEIARARRKRPENLNAYDYTMRALPHVWTLQREDNRMALELLDQAIALDPEYPLASALAAWCHQQQVAYMWSTDRDASRKNAVRLARQAVSISEDDPLVLTVLGTVQTLARNHEAATPLIERALAIDPNFAWGWNRSGWLRTYKNEPEPAIRDFERAIRLSPLDPMNFNCFMGIAAAHSCAERYEQAIYWVKKALAERPGIVWANRGLVMPYVYLGRMEEARAAIATLLYEYPDLTVRQVIDSVPWGPEILSRYADAFREAGLPE